MAGFLYSAAMSLDGFIAGPGGDMSWITPHFRPNVVHELIPRIGALLVGGRTYGGDDPLEVYSPLNSGGRLANIAVMPSVRSRLGRNAEFHAATYRRLADTAAVRCSSSTSLTPCTTRGGLA